jgi:hypothetical protein
MADASQSDLDRANFKSGFAHVGSGATKTINGVITTFPFDGLTDNWRRERLPALKAVSSRAATFLLPEDLQTLHDTATEVAGQMSDPEVKASLISLAATFAPADTDSPTSQ